MDRHTYTYTHIHVEKIKRRHKGKYGFRDRNAKMEDLYEK